MSRIWLWTAIGIATFGLVLEAMHLAVLFTLSHSAAYEAAKQFVEAEPTISREIGHITNIDLIAGKGDWSSTEGQANLKMRIKGFKTNGTIVVLLIKWEGKWSAIRATLDLNEGKVPRVLKLR